MNSTVDSLHGLVTKNTTSARNLEQLRKAFKAHASDVLGCLEELEADRSVKEPLGLAASVTEDIQDLPNTLDNLREQTEEQTVKGAEDLADWRDCGSSKVMSGVFM